MILNAGDLTSEGQQLALARLCETYWRPLYCYTRQRGSSIDDAEDLTQEFFRNLLEKNVVEHADRDRGKFRTFLLTSMKNFLSNEWRRATAEKRGGGKAPIRLDADAGETLFLTSAIEHSTPETIFDKSWAIATLEEAMLHLEADYDAKGKGDLFRELRLLLWDDGSATYSQLGDQLGMSEAAVKMAVKRLRERAQEQLRTEITNTVGHSEEVEEEFRYLQAVLQS